MKNKKVLVAMSGGVDSSVAAALLKKQGFQIEGLFIFFQEKTKMKNSYISAKKVAKILNIKLNTLDLSKIFKKEIIDDFVNEYKKGNTPNPCIRCNKLFKFGKLLDFAKKLNCDYLATGHYAKTKKHFDTKTLKHKYKLITAKDKNKDQTYFLYELTQDKLKYILFPLGKFKKEKVKKLAKKFNLPVYAKKESSDVCFLSLSRAESRFYRDGVEGPRNLQEFLKSKIDMTPGNIIDTQKKIIGKHKGLHFYTLGQRQGINIGGTGPYYVIKKDFKNNTLIVTNDKNDPQLFSDELFVKNINWISEEVKPDFKTQLNLKCLAQHRYQTKMCEVKIFPSPLMKGRNEEGLNNLYKIKYKKPQRAVTPGQSIVFYKKCGQNFQVLGGGVIESA